MKYYLIGYLCAMASIHSFPTKSTQSSKHASADQEMKQDEDIRLRSSSKIKTNSKEEVSHVLRLQDDNTVDRKDISPPSDQHFHHSSYLKDDMSPVIDAQYNKQVHKKSGHAVEKCLAALLIGGVIVDGCFFRAGMMASTGAEQIRSRVELKPTLNGTVAAAMFEVSQLVGDVVIGRMLRGEDIKCDPRFLMEISPHEHIETLHATETRVLDKITLLCTQQHQHCSNPAHGGDYPEDGVEIPDHCGTVRQALNKMIATHTEFPDQLVEWKLNLEHRFLRNEEVLKRPVAYIKTEDYPKELRDAQWHAEDFKKPMGKYISPLNACFSRFEQCYVINPRPDVRYFTDQFAVSVDDVFLFMTDVIYDKKERVERPDPMLKTIHDHFSDKLWWLPPYRLYIQNKLEKLHARFHNIGTTANNSHFTIGEEGGKSTGKQKKKQKQQERQQEQEQQEREPGQQEQEQEQERERGVERGVERALELERALERNRERERELKRKQEK